MAEQVSRADGAVGQEEQPQTQPQAIARTQEFGIGPSDVDPNDPEAVREFLEGPQGDI